MGHKAGAEFFERKREWSRRKDRILEEYLPAYIQKVSRALRRPVLIVDAFAGPGAFEDGSLGSPTIIEGVAREARKRPGVSVNMLFIEKDPGLHARLASRFQSAPGVQVRQGSMLEHIAEVESLSETHTTFLYLDPYTVEGLEWEALDRIFRRVEAGSSVEVLLNFNAHSFGRRGRQALGRREPAPHEDSDDPDLEGIDGGDLLLKQLDDIVGGDWWRAVLANEVYDVRGLVRGFCEQLQRRFRHVCYQEVLERVGDRVPKYAMVFGSRSGVALELMNDAMCSAREMFVRESEEAQKTLFETRPESIVRDARSLTRLVLTHAQRPKKRRDLRREFIRTRPGSWSCSEINKELGSMLRNGQLQSETGETRINDETVVWMR
jgi:three-Cys-motif partner protein